MVRPQLKRPDLPEYMTWDELERLPGEIAEQIELWDGRVVWLRRGPTEHQTFSVRCMIALEAAARKAMSEHSQQCWKVTVESNVFLGHSGKSDFLTPDFMVHHCLAPYQDVRAIDVVLVGEVLSPSNTHADIEAKKARYASAGIPWYWEVCLVHGSSAIASIRAYALEIAPGHFPEGVRPLRPVNYVVAGEWMGDDPDGIVIDHPFPIRIAWSELAF